VAQLFLSYLKKKQKQTNWKELLSEILDATTKFLGAMATWCLGFVKPLL
jgi:hypothetical protein